MTVPIPQPVPLQKMRRWERVARVTTLGGVALTLLSAMLDFDQFLQAWLLGFLFWWLVTMGCLTLLMLHAVVGGRWGSLLQPWTEAGAVMAPVMALLFLPVAVHLDALFPWMQPEAISQEKALYLNAPFFYGRASFYFLVWCVFALMLRSHMGHDARRLPWRMRNRTGISAVGLVLIVLTVTFACIDWSMSLNPHWFSSIYGALMLMGGTLAALALVTVMTAVIGGMSVRRAPDDPVDDDGTDRPTTSSAPLAPPAARLTVSSSVDPDTLGDLGTLMLSFVMLSAYFTFSQFLIIWSGNLPEENVWYVDRLQGGWQWMGLSIVLLQFLVPFMGLLSRNRNQRPGHLTLMGLLIFLMQFVCVMWIVCPAFHPRAFTISWPDVVIPVTIGSVWISLVLWRVRSRTQWVAREVEL